MNKLEKLLAMLILQDQLTEDEAAAIASCVEVGTESAPIAIGVLIDPLLEDITNANA